MTLGDKPGKHSLGQAPEVSALGGEPRGQRAPRRHVVWRALCSAVCSRKPIAPSNYKDKVRRSQIVGRSVTSPTGRPQNRQVIANKGRLMSQPGGAAGG